MTWNHRVIKKVYPSGEEEFSIREVYYNEKGEINAYSSDPIDLACETVEDLKEYIQWCLNACDTPVLIDGEVEFAKDELSEEDIKEMKSVLTEEEFKKEMDSWNEEKNK